MPFTDRYIKLPIKIYDAAQENLTGKDAHDCDTIELAMRINPFKIEDYWPCIPGESAFDEDNLTCTRLVMESGERHLVYMPVDEFEKLLNTHL